MIYPLLSLIPTLTKTPIGVVSGIFRGAKEEDILKFVRENNIQHIEIHHDTLDLVNFCQDNKLSFSYHSRWKPEDIGIENEDKDENFQSREFHRIEKLIARGCSQIIAHANTAPLDKIQSSKPIATHIAFENLDRNNLQYRKTQDFTRLFQVFPDAHLCLDLGHLWDIPKQAEQFVQILGDKIIQVHLCETDRKTGGHLPTVSPEFTNWIKEIVPQIAAKFIILEPPLEVNITDPQSLG